ncbi:hypothetical protein DMUE_0500 [Dictyocoela muelleri]|nr:hypothetical protein DMUE_0500 [Dictyocoela muelleri]
MHRLLIEPGKMSASKFFIKPVFFRIFFSKTGCFIFFFQKPNFKKNCRKTDFLSPRITELTSYKALMKYIEGRDSFKIYKNTLSSVFCNKDLTYNPKEGTRTLNRHLTTNSHIHNVNRSRKPHALETICNKRVINETFDRKLVEAFVALNVPLINFKPQF